MKNIFVYADNGASEVGVESLLQICKKKFENPVQKIFAKDIIEKNILNDAKILIFPGGAGIPYCEKLNGTGNQKIREFVKNGGCYLGICAGAYYACKDLSFHGEEYDVFETWELQFFNGTAVGSLSELTNGRYYDETVFAKAFVNVKLENGEVKKYYYHGGPTFVADSQNDDSYKIVGKFENGKSAMIQGNFGDGKYFLSSVHFELQKEPYEKIVMENAPSDEISYERELFESFYDGYGDEIWEKIKNYFK